jgi:hypothetical protein
MIKHSGLTGRSGRRTCKQHQQCHANKQQPGLPPHSQALEYGMTCCATFYPAHISTTTRHLPDLNLVE